MDITLHINPTQKHHREHAEWLTRGFSCHGITLEVTTEITKPSDIHIVTGPHYAKSAWLNHPNTILLDSAYYHSIKTGEWFSTDYVSLGWMNEYGKHDYLPGTGKPIPTKEVNGGSGTIFLADYNGEIEIADTIRYHPTNKQSSIVLEDDLRRHAIAIGYSTTALVKAALMGLKVVAKDEHHILNQPNWIELLPYVDWHYSEIQSGKFWEHLCQRLEQ